jgi:hypothetical protein
VTARGLPADDPLRALPPDELDALLDEIIESWPTSDPPTSDHLRLEIAAAARRGRSLEPGELVPGCACPTCTGIPEDHLARRRVAPRRRGQRRPALDVDAARAVPVVEVARRLGCGEPVRRGEELHVRCPLHDDEDPSLRVHPDGLLWYCDPCGEGGDGIGLWMRSRSVTFIVAVRELLGAACP